MYVSRAADAYAQGLVVCARPHGQNPEVKIPVIPSSKKTELFKKAVRYAICNGGEAMKIDINLRCGKRNISPSGGDNMKMAEDTQE